MTLMKSNSLWLLVLLSPLALQAQTGTLHNLPLTPSNVHWGHYDASLVPVLRVRSGDLVRVESLVARGLGRMRDAGAPESDFRAAMIEVESTVTERGPGAHPMTGPIYVEGAEPGDVLEVRILETELLMPSGVSAYRQGGGALPDAFEGSGLRLFEFDEKAGVARMGSIATIPLRPFFGSIGVAPRPDQGRISSTAPGEHVGNLDNKDLVAGTTLYLPVHTSGGLLSIGDGHAAQGDGEVSGTAIETSLGGTFQVILHRDRTLRWPRAETPTHYVSMGLDPDLDEAARIATQEMIDFLVRDRGMDAADAYVLCSVALDLRITQLVDGTKGVHGMLAKALFR
jgi:acetamidase/formamidase